MNLFPVVNRVEALSVKGSMYEYLFVHAQAHRNRGFLFSYDRLLHLLCRSQHFLHSTYFVASFIIHEGLWSFEYRFGCWLRIFHLRCECRWIVTESFHRASWKSRSGVFPRGLQKVKCSQTSLVAIYPSHCCCSLTDTLVWFLLEFNRRLVVCFMEHRCTLNEQAKLDPISIHVYKSNRTLFAKENKTNRVRKHSCSYGPYYTESASHGFSYRTRLHIYYANLRIS